MYQLTPATKKYDYTDMGKITSETTARFCNTRQPTGWKLPTKIYLLANAHSMLTALLNYMENAILKTYFAAVRNTFKRT